MFVHYCKLNAQTIPDSYPMPSIDDLLNKKKPTPYISTIDLRSDYHQVKIAKEDQEKGLLFARLVLINLRAWLSNCAIFWPPFLD